MHIKATYSPHIFSIVLIGIKDAHYSGVLVCERAGWLSY